MLFNSYTFIIFFAVVLFLHNLPLSWTVRKFNLLIASYIFYAAWSPPFVLLIWISTLVDWFIAKRMHRAEDQRVRKILLVLSLATNLGLLGFFKYAGFAVENFTRLMSVIGVDYQPVAPGIVLPVGISFYTFQTLSYTFEIYRRHTKPWKSFLDYALFVTFFPQLVAGPIVRSVDFLPQCIEPRRASTHQLSWGFSLLVIGLFEKVVVADGLLANIADKVYAMPAQAGFVDSWLGTLAFSGQIFCDFAGYSTCAIGVALCLGFAIQDNFKFPYAAIGFSDFWRRWHISLSTWLRDYLYIALGGNRSGPVRTYVNLALTMLLGGLWHGAAWTFVVWGGLHGLFLVVERLLRAYVGEARVWSRPVVRVLLAIGTYLLVCVTWVFFRASDFPTAFQLVGSMVGLRSGGAESLVKTSELIMVLGVVGGMLALHWKMRDTSIEEMANRFPWWFRSAVLAGCLLAVMTMSGDTRAFIYFQF